MLPRTAWRSRADRKERAPTINVLLSWKLTVCTVYIAYVAPVYGQIAVLSDR